MVRDRARLGRRGGACRYPSRIRARGWGWRREAGSRAPRSSSSRLRLRRTFCQYEMKGHKEMASWEGSIKGGGETYHTSPSSPTSSNTLFSRLPVSITSLSRAGGRTHIPCPSVPAVSKLPMRLLSASYLRSELAGRKLLLVSCIGHVISGWKCDDQVRRRSCDVLRVIDISGGQIKIPLGSLEPLRYKANACEAPRKFG